MNVIVTEEIFDKEYVANYGFGFENFTHVIQRYTPEWAYPETGIDPQTIRATAREMAQHKPATLVHPGRHVTWYGDDTQRERAIALLNALLGSWGRKGGFYQAGMMDIPSYPYPPFPEPGPKADNPGHKYPFALESLTTGIREATITGVPYPVKGWIVYATNLMQALPNQEETKKAIQNLDLLVAVDIVPSELAGWADVVLPEAGYLERYDDLNVEYFREPFISLRQPVMNPPGEAKPNWWIAKKLAGKLGLDQYFPWNHIEEYLDNRLKAAGYSLTELKQQGVIRGAKIPNYFEDGVIAEFATPSGKIEFFSTQLESMGFDPVPKYRRPAGAPPGFYRLLFGRAPVHTFGRTQTNPILMEMKQENEVWVNSSIAQKHGFKTGQKIRLVNQDGIKSSPISVKATEMIRTDCVYMVHGFGHTAKRLTRALGKGASDSQLITRYETDPLMGGTGMNVNFVTFAPVEP